jgi:cyclase
LNRWGIDEIALVDIDATPEKRGPLTEKISAYSRHCQVPLAVGGGITTVEQMKQLVHAGADKIIINTAAIKNPKLITEGAWLFGNQCIVVSIDVLRHSSGEYEVFSNSGKTATGKSPVELAKIAEASGAGEIMLNSINRDGSKIGYDLGLLERVVKAVSIPIIVCGGVSHPKHFLEAMKYDVSAVAAANFFHYTEHSVVAAKQFLKAAQATIRLDSYATYNNFNFDPLGRVMKLADPTLEKLRFEYIPEEII